MEWKSRLSGLVEVMKLDDRERIEQAYSISRYPTLPFLTTATHKPPSTLEHPHRQNTHASAFNPFSSVLTSVFSAATVFFKATSGSGAVVSAMVF